MEREEEIRLLSRLQKIADEINELTKKLSPFLIKIAHLKNEAEMIRKQIEETKVENTPREI